jgi:hypothetical protein
VRSLNPSGTSFGAVLPNQSGCETVLLPIESSWASPGEVGERVWGKLSDECRYRPASGSSGAWFYGCDVGVDADYLLDQKAGWRFGATACVPTKRPVCKDVAASRLVSGRARVRRTGRTDLRLVEAVSYPGGQRLRSAAVTLERLPLEEDGAGELINHPSGVDRAPARPLRVRHRAERAPFATADHRRGPLVTCRLRDRGRRFDRRLRLVVRVEGARLEQPRACIAARARVKLEPRVGLAFRSGARVSVPIRARWRCSIASNGRLAGLGHGPGVGVRAGRTEPR